MSVTPKGPAHHFGEPVDIEGMDSWMGLTRLSQLYCSPDYYGPTTPGCDFPYQVNYLYHEMLWRLFNIILDQSGEDDEFRPTWRLKDRLRTSAVALVLCLNLGTDPPNVVKPSPCARKECWFDPTNVSKQKGVEIIGNTLQQQYEKLQSKSKFKPCYDPTSDDLRRVCVNLRKAARSERLLMHYNGHGVPRPTENGELWTFGKNYTYYMPVSVLDIRSWFGDPAIYVLDCSGAGILMPFFCDNSKNKDAMADPAYYSKPDKRSGAPNRFEYTI